MSGPFLPVEACLKRGDLMGAGEEFGKLRPGLKGTLEGLKLAARIHSAAKDWDKVGVLSRVMRKEFPTDVAGFQIGANSLHEQGRDIEAIGLLKLWNDAGADQTVGELIAEYQANLDGGTPVDVPCGQP